MTNPREDELEALEQQFPPASGIAFADARDSVLASGQSVLQSENGAIFEVSPDGTQRFVKSIAPPMNVQPGQKIELP
jgi:hypothetical protein